MRSVETVKETRNELLEKVGHLIALRKEIITLNRELNRTKNRDDAMVMSYLDRVITQTNGQINALNFVLNEDSDLNDYSNDRFFAEKYNLTKEYVENEYLEMLREAKVELYKSGELRFGC